MRQRWTRRFVIQRAATTALGVAGSALLAACGGAAAISGNSSSVSVSARATTAATALSSATTTAAASQTAAATHATQAAATSAAQRPGTAARTVWWFATNGLEKEEETGWNGVFAAFEKAHPELKVQFTNANGTKYTAAIAGGTYPDVHEPVTKELPSWVYKQADIDMTSYVQKAKVDKSAYTASQMEKVIFNGKWYGIPWDTSPAVIFYNKSLFQKAGVAEPPKKWGDPKWTWDAFLEIAKKTTTSSGADATFGFNQTNWWVYYNPWAWSNGGDFTDKERAKITITDSAYVDAYQWYADLRNVHHAAPDPTQAKQATWNNGKIAMFSSGSYTTVGMDQRMKSTDWDVAPYPTGRAGVFTRAPGDCCSMVNHAPHPDDGLTALLFVTGPIGQKMLAQLGYVPVLKEAQQSPDFLQPSGHVSRGVFIDGLEISRPTPVPFIYPDVNTAFGKVMDQMLAGTITAKTMMEQLAPQFQTLLDKAPPEWRSVD